MPRRTPSRNDLPEPSTSRPGAEASETFLGGLALEPTSSLPAEFATLLGSARALLELYRDGALDGDDTAELLGRLRITDAHGSEWTVGATSMAWYRRMSGEAWSPTAGPDGTVPVVQGPDDVIGDAHRRIRAHQAAGLGTPADSGSLDAGLAGGGPFVGAQPGDEPAPQGTPVAVAVPDTHGTGPLEPGLQPGGAVDAPETVPYAGPFATLPPTPSRATGADPWAGIEGEADDELVARLLGPEQEQ